MPKPFCSNRDLRSIVAVFVASIAILISPMTMAWGGDGTLSAAIATTPLRPAPIATSPGGTTGADDAFGPVDYLAAAARLTLRFRGYPELTGDYRVSPDHMISIPVIGRIYIAGLDTEALEKALSTKLSQVTQKDAFVTVEIAAYHSVFVTGFVKNPGAIEWRPDLTVLQAITLVGGMATEAMPGPIPGSGESPLALQKAIDAEKRDLATIAKLQAERQGAPQITVPPQLISLVGPGGADELIARESKTLASDRESVAAKLAALQQGITAGNTEMASLREQISKLNAQLQLRRDFGSKVRDLFTKGIVTAERNLEEEIKVTDLEEKITNINVGLAKSAGTVAELQLSAVALKRDRDSAIGTELARIERESAQLSLEISAARHMPAPLPQQASKQVGDTPKSPLQIVRQQSGGTTTIAADEGTLMRPGDVLIVGRS